MIGYTDLKKGMFIVLDGNPYEIIETSFLRMQQRKAVVNTKIKNLTNGKILDRNWQASDEFEEAELEKKNAIFIYESKGEYWFNEEGNPRNRFSLPADVLGDAAQFLKPNTAVATVTFKDKVISVKMPVKMDFKVVEAPPGVKGNTAQGGTKQVTIETGAKINAPLFVNQDDIIRVNTETGEYVERVNK